MPSVEYTVWTSEGIQAYTGKVTKWLDGLDDCMFFIWTHFSLPTPKSKACVFCRTKYKNMYVVWKRKHFMGTSTAFTSSSLEELTSFICRNGYQLCSKMFHNFLCFSFPKKGNNTCKNELIYELQLIKSRAKYNLKLILPLF